MSERIVHTSDATFEQDVLNASEPVLLDFWAEWCAPCKAIAPLLEDLAEQYEGRVTIAKLNIDDNQATAARFGVRGIPTLLLFKDGQVEAQSVGSKSKSQLAALLDSNL